MKAKHTDFEVKSIVCAPKHYEMLKARYPKRSVVPVVYCGENSFIVIKHVGTYVVSLPEFKVYVYKYTMVRR